jgi:3-hydroxybutyryl-CoA dehydratase
MEHRVFELPFNQLELGHRLRSRARTMTETDVVNFCSMTGNWLDIHADAEFSRTSKFGQRVVQGGLVFVVTNALFGFDAKIIAAFYGVDNLRFRKPTFIGDTLHAEREIIRLRPKDDNYGVATAKLEAWNQRSEVVMSCDFSLLVYRSMPSADKHQS